MKRIFYFFLFSLFACVGCVTDPSIGALKMDEAENKRVVREFLEGENPVKCEAYGFVPNIYSALFIGYYLDLVISDVYGFNFADIYTQNASVTGVNVSPLFSHVDNLNALSITGLYSVSDKQNILDIAGVCSQTKECSGVQFGGLFAYASKNVVGGQISGGVTCAEQLKGVQLSGLCSVARMAAGVQFSGLLCHAQNSHRWGRESDNFNVQVAGGISSTENLKGVQLATYNHVEEDMRGVQLGGVNFAKNVKAGIQLGAININIKRNRKYVDTEKVLMPNGEFVDKDIYEDELFKTWQFGALNKTSSGWWIPISNFGIF